MDSKPPDNSLQRRTEITEADLAPAPAAGHQPAGPSTVAPSRASGANVAGSEWTESTRLMCAAAYLDGTFAQDVVDEVLGEEHRAVQIPAGVDIVPVARHCLAALRQKTTRDVLLCLDAVFAVVALFGLRSLGLLVLSFVIAWAVVFWDMWMSTYYEVVKRLNVRAFSPQDAPAPLDSRMTRRIEDLATSQQGNTTVYSGFLPFVGAGFEAGGWSLVVDLDKGKPGLGPPSAVQQGEVYTAVREAIDALGIANLSIEDRLYVQGTDIRYDPDLLPHPTRPPASTTDAAVVQSMIGNMTHRIRHYQCVRVVDWRGELVVSLYLRFPIQSGRMFCEYNNFLLPPLKEEIHRADGLGASIELRQVAAILRRSGLATLGLWPRSPRVILKPLTRSREASRKLKEVERNPLFDYGARHTALDRVRSTNYRRFFQRVDKEMYVKLLERLVLDKIIEVLSQHGIDTSPIDETRATIVNNGVMTGGGSVTAQNLAVGSNAGIVNRVRGAMSAARGAGATNTGGGGESGAGGTS
ncbi:MAG TPA: hypothetical protein VGG98_00935 [Solirubrobacteraceae bacterium]|jgi:hypothetical protein